MVRLDKAFLEKAVNLRGFHFAWLNIFIKFDLRQEDMTEKCLMERKALQGILIIFYFVWILA